MGLNRNGLWRHCPAEAEQSDASCLERRPSAASVTSSGRREPLLMRVPGQRVSPDPD
jgi:hypothetical protein